MNIWIKNGHLLDPGTNRDGMFDLFIKDGKVAAVGSFPSKYVSQEELDTCRVVDAAGKYVMPGFIDLHVHYREPGLEYKETIETGTMAAARGGFTGTCPMPNTKPSTDCPEMIEKVLDIANREGHVRVYPVGAVTIGQNGEEMTDIEGMVKAGAKAISEDGKSVMNAGLYREAMKVAKRLDIPVFAHCEDKNMVGNGALNEGAKSKELGVPGITNAVEDVIVARDILLAKETGVRLHLCHCSTKDSVELIRLAKENGIQVSGEVCPHHFAMSDQDITSDDANYKMNPPLRSPEDVLALKEGLKDGVMEVISTDHAPHSEEEKKLPIAKAPFGIVGLETAFALTVTHLVLEGYLTPMQMVEKMSTNPARILGVEGGTLREGSVADLVIADMNERYVINPSEFASKGKNTPFAGMEVVGRIEKTMVAGEFVYEWR